jgi:hypothetical protein
MVTEFTPYDELPEMLTVVEYRAVMRIKRTAAYDMLRSDRIPHVRHGHLIRIPKSVLRTQARDNVA